MDSSVSLQLPRLGISETSERNNSSVRSETDPDATLVTDVARGSREALGLLFRRYAGLVRGVALRVLKDASEADDLVQDVFVLIHRVAQTFDSSKASVQFWIVQMTYRRALSRRQYLNSRHFYTRQELDEQAIPTTIQGAERGKLLLSSDWRSWIWRNCSDRCRKTNKRLFGFTSSRATPWMKSQKSSGRLRAISGTIRSAAWSASDS
ncbi:MAG TPA: sigma factor [Candidatus Sulfotelmatobacter sp.]|nr:sigma factor [Candidatus Sulfotelmatobacter sp.]